MAICGLAVKIYLKGCWVMKTCPSCGELLGNDVTKCFKCGALMSKSEGYQKICPRCNLIFNSKATECERCHGPLSVYSSALATAQKQSSGSGEFWPYLLAFLFPYIGIILGLIFVAQKRDNGGGVLGLSLVCLIIFGVIIGIVLSL